jgi:anti-sigma factor RsiW
MDPESWSQKPCTDLRVGDLIIPYALGLLTEEERTRVEIHVLECEACYVGLLSVDRTATMLKRFLDARPDDYLKRLRKKRGSLRRLLDRGFPAISILGGGFTL